MHFILNKPGLLASLALSGILSMQDAGAATIASPADESLQTETAPQWTLVTAFSHSFFNRNYDSWHKESVELYYYLPDIKVLLGTSMDFEERSASRSDLVYGFNARWYATKPLQLHSGIKLTDDADFLPGERYTLGMQYRVNPELELLFDVERLEFQDQVAIWDDGITQIKPGFTWWMNEHNRVTLRYIHGWVHDHSDFDYYSAKFHFADLIRDGVLSVGLAYGSDPDFGFGSTATTLTDAYILSVFYTEPIKENLKIIVGIEYVYRLRPDNNRELYQMLTPTIGLSWNF